MVGVGGDGVLGVGGGGVLGVVVGTWCRWR